MLNWPLGGNGWHDGLRRQSRLRIQNAMPWIGRCSSTACSFWISSRCSDGWLTRGTFPRRNRIRSDALLAEGRRMVGHAVVSERDLLPVTPQARRPPEATSIAVGTYANDHHYPGDDWPLARRAAVGGVGPVPPSAFPLRHWSVPMFQSARREMLQRQPHGQWGNPAATADSQHRAGRRFSALAVRCNLDRDLPVESLQQLIDEPQAPAAVMPIWDWPAGIRTGARPSIVHCPTETQRTGS